jgi:hypothetical protein
MDIVSTFKPTKATAAIMNSAQANFSVDTRFSINLEGVRPSWLKLEIGIVPFQSIRQKLVISGFGYTGETTITASKHNSNILIMANYSIDIPEVLVIFRADFGTFRHEKL